MPLRGPVPVSRRARGQAPVRAAPPSPGSAGRGAALDFARCNESAQTGRKEVPTMISANITNADRKAVYKRDNYLCALCDSPQGLQLHHVVLRSQGGTDYPHNLIALCWRCHAIAHGTRLPECGDIQPAEVCQACVEYLADYYAQEGLLWNPWARQMERLVE